MTTLPTIENTQKAIELNIRKLQGLLKRLTPHVQRSDNLANLFEMGHLYTVTLTELHEVLKERKVLSASDIESLSEELEEAENVTNLVEKALTVVNDGNTNKAS